MKDVVHSAAMAYAATTMAVAMMAVLFDFYYVDLFLNVYGVDSQWFYTSEILYMMWNTVNDPLCAWLQDHGDMGGVTNSVDRRRKSILSGAKYLVVSFMIPWIPFSIASSSWVKGIHLTLSLSFYDSMFTYMSLAQNALFADMTANPDHRNTILRYSQIASIIGTSCVFIAFAIYEHSNLLPFRSLTFAVAVLGLLLLRYTASHATIIPNDDQSQQQRVGDEKVVPPNHDDPTHSFFSVARQVFRTRDFKVFVAMNFLQVFDVTVSSNFFAIVEKTLLGHDSWPQWTRSMIVGASFILPQVFAFSLTPWISKLGSYTVIMYTFYWKVVICLLTYLFVSQESTTLVAFFLIVNRTIPQGAFYLFGLPLSDIVDHDNVTNNRPHSMSSTVFGLNALCTKPAQSIGPMIVFSLLMRSGYEPHSIQRGHEEMPSISFQRSLFSTITLVPFFLGVLQIIVWRQYKLRGDQTRNETKVLIA